MRPVELRYAAAVLLVCVAVLGAGRLLAGPEAAGGVAAAVGIAGAFQLLAFWLARALFGERRLLAYGVGMLGRFALVAFTAFLIVPRAGLPAAATLFALVSVLFPTTVLEPVLLAPTATPEPR